MSLVFIILFLLICVSLLAFAVLGMSLSLLSVPYVPVSSQSLNSIINALQLNKTSTLFDLGSGDGKVLFACAQAQPEATYIGIEYHFFPHLLAKLRLHKLTKRQPSADYQIQLRNDSFFNHNLNSATHIFTYLFINMMDKLLPKLEKELQKGTRLVSCDFPFTHKKPIEVIDIPGADHEKRCKKLYIYEF